MKKLAPLFLTLIAFSANAAHTELLWQQRAPMLRAPYQHKPLAKQHNGHKRLLQTYQGLPIFGYELIAHPHHLMTGMQISGIEQDLTDLNPTLSTDEALKKLCPKAHHCRHVSIEKNIFIDDKHKAHLAYHIRFVDAQSPSTKPSLPHVMMDAHSGETLLQWDGIADIRHGQGLGGNAFSLPYRAGTFQYGQAIPSLPSLGQFDVEIIDFQCFVKNHDIAVINLENRVLGYGAFPITEATEINQNIHAYSYPCSALSQYLNYNDGTSGPVNYAFSPVNDTMYFATETIEMYQKIYGVSEPLGQDLPVRAYTHLGRMDNAFAIPTLKENGKIISHQQIVIGNGDKFLTAPSQAVIAHELSHNFTALHSGLIYAGQSGGINEAFSDMAAIALQDYIQKRYPWYWDGEDWTIGREAMIGGTPLRYLDVPSKDGRSIDHASDYHDWLDVHHSSGVFNRAFYLLAHEPGWSVQKAFQVMIDANMHYWSPIAYYDFAACGVIQAAADRHYDTSSVIHAFSEVGVRCPIAIR